ncbi:MAG: hypothetical protein AABX11_05620 [Nanoarchaeota archaeon]
MPKKSSESKVANHSHSINEVLVQNLIELQKVHTHLLEKIDKMNNQLSHLLTIFEVAAKNFGENPLNQNSEKDKEFLNKIDALLEQNKTIAKGLTLMEEHTREKLYANQEPKEEEKRPMTPRPLPKF